MRPSNYLPDLVGSLHPSGRLLNTRTVDSDMEVMFATLFLNQSPRNRNKIKPRIWIYRIRI